MSGYDVWRISTGQRLSPEQFLVACPQHEPGLDGFRLGPDEPAYGLALDKQGQFEPTRPCVFLMHLAGGHTRCGVYEHRPAVCRAYPMSIWSMQVSQMENSLCPPGSWSEGNLKRSHWRTSIQALYMQSDIYHEVVARWNARVAAYEAARFTLHEYFSYLLNVYDRLAALNAEVGEEALAEIQAAWPTSPRPKIDPADIPRLMEEQPWVNYAMRARRVIDGFYPQIAAQPMVSLLAQYAPASVSKLPLDGKQ